MNTFKGIVIILFSGLILSSCQEYLERTPEAEVTESDIFGTFTSFQGYVESMYSKVTDYSGGLITAMNLGGETNATNAVNSSRLANTGNYLRWVSVTGNQTLYRTVANSENDYGIWSGSWQGIRTANIALDKLSLLTNATQEERDLIAGQAYFFRAWFHWEIIRSFGGMPYIDRVLQPNDDLNFPRLTYQETTELIVADFDRAIALLPENWDNTVVGGAFQGANAGRATKGAAMAFKAKALLYAGSPLMNKFSGKNYEFDLDYMKRAADAAWEVIKLANQGVYTLVPLSEYRNMFGRNDGNNTWTTETIFQRMDPRSGSARLQSGHGRIYSPARYSGNASTECVNQFYVDKFEMADGTRYKVEYDTDNARRWDDRDPRFRQNILVDRDQWGFSSRTLLRTYFNSTGNPDERAASSTEYSSPYIVKKYWPMGVNSYDNQMANYRWLTPHMRLADVYLIYAEAVNEAYGPMGTANNSTLTAVGAINVLRMRAGMPDVSATSYVAAGYDSFRDLVRNERNVELCFEGNYWFDIRRWYIAHLPENKEFIDFQFDNNWTSFTRVPLFTRVFDDPKHYWMPLPIEQTQIFRGFYQNPGW
jgi:starch-binding outer membrane protein, SusD/RagB family